MRWSCPAQGALTENLWDRAPAHGLAPRQLSARTSATRTRSPPGGPRTRSRVESTSTSTSTSLHGRSLPVLEPVRWTRRSCHWAGGRFFVGGRHLVGDEGYAAAVVRRGPPDDLRTEEVPVAPPSAEEFAEAPRTVLD